MGSDTSRLWMPRPTTDDEAPDVDMGHDYCSRCARARGEALLPGSDKDPMMEVRVEDMLAIKNWLEHGHPIGMVIHRMVGYIPKKYTGPGHG